MTNSYFGGSMASVVFQEIRESKSLAYFAYSFYADANKAGDPNYTYAYIDVDYLFNFEKALPIKN